MFTRFTAVIIIPFFYHQSLHTGHAAGAVNKIMNMFTLFTAVKVIPLSSQFLHTGHAIEATDKILQILHITGKGTIIQTWY